jgi:hypothetical protein
MPKTPKNKKLNNFGYLSKIGEKKRDQMGENSKIKLNL